MAALGLVPGVAVGVDTRVEPKEGDLVLVEVETDDLSDRLIRRLTAIREDGALVLSSTNQDDFPDLIVPQAQSLLLGVVTTRVQFTPQGEHLRVIEEPL